MQTVLIHTVSHITMNNGADVHNLFLISRKNIIYKHLFSIIRIFITAFFIDKKKP